ncbi:MAG: sensor histidine kinase [Planctomycetota bacterium]|jgi:two-component system sensor histidine kinase QseC
MYSIRRRLLLILIAGFAVLIAGAGLLMEGSLRQQATAEFDAALIAEARALVSLTEQEIVSGASGSEWQVEFDYDAVHMTQFEREEGPDYFQFWLEDGSLLMRSSRLDADLPRTDSRAAEPKVQDARLPDGRAGRVVQFTYSPRQTEESDSPVVADPALAPHTLLLVVGRGRDSLDRVLAGMRWTIFGAGGGAVLLAILLVSWAVGVGFRPIRSIAEQVSRLDAEQLESVVQLTHTPEELAPIQDQLNALLGRLRDSFERERRFTGNVAHELKTPLAELRSLADVGGQWPEDREAVVGFFADVGDIAQRMDGVIADLLLLARCQAGAEQVRRAPTDLEEVIASAWSRLEPQANGSGLRFSLDMPEDPVVDSDAGKLDIVFSNVLGNAISYAPPGSEIRCSGRRNGKALSLEFTNAAAPMEGSDLERLAEPFWRKDESRSSSRHAGLGLSVVEAVSALLRMRVGFGQDQDGTFRVSLEHPT